MFKSAVSSIRDEIAYGGHLQSLGAASVVFVSAIILEIQPTWDLLVSAYLIFYPLYLYNRFEEIEIDRLTNPKRTLHLKKYLSLIPAILIISIILLLAIIFSFGNSSALLFSIFLVFFGLLYTKPFKGMTKKLPLFKNFYVALFFSLLVLFTAVYSSHSLNSMLIEISLLMAFVFLKAFFMQVFLDIKDIEGDKESKLLTLGAQIGKIKTLKFLEIAVSLTTIIFLFFFSVFLNIFPVSILMLLLTVPFCFYYFSLSKKGDYFAYILAGGEFILWSPLILIGKILI